MRKVRKKYSKEFKEEAVRLATSGERSQQEVAESLGVDHSLVRYWIRTLRNEGAEAFRGHGKRTAADEETWRLKLKVKQLEEELEFLKKVSRYFAKDQK